LGRHQ
jgi:hypothetical protein